MKNQDKPESFIIAQALNLTHGTILDKARLRYSFDITTGSNVHT